MKKILFSLMILLMLAGCAKPPDKAVLTVMTHDSFSISEETVRLFEQENDVTLVFLKTGDTGAALNRAILTRNAPQADVFYGVDNTYLSRAVDADIFDPYQPEALGMLPQEMLVGTAGLVTPIDYGDVCINYDRTYFTEHGLTPPGSLAELLDPRYSESANGSPLLVLENPATSSPGLAFLLATIAEYGEEGYLDYWRSLQENGVEVVNDWETAYYSNFSASSGKGLQPMVVSYAASPAAEVIFASEPLEAAPTASLTAPGMCFRQVEYAGILKGTKQANLAEKFIDFMLSDVFQSDIPMQMFMYPVNPAVQLPDEFVRYALLAERPATLDPELISENRDHWIQAWSEVMLP